MVIGMGSASLGTVRRPVETIFDRSMSERSGGVSCGRKADGVSISAEGLKTYRDSLQQMETDRPAGYDDKSELKEIMSKSVVDITGKIESDLHTRFTGLNTASGKDKCRASDYAGNLLTAYTQMYQEIKQGYEEGTREIWTADPAAENGYRKVTQEEELDALKEAMDFHAMVVDGYLNHGKEEGWKAREAVERTRAEIEKREYESGIYQKEEETEHMYQKLMQAVDSITSQFAAFGDDLPYLVNKVMQENMLIHLRGEQ